MEAISGLDAPRAEPSLAPAGSIVSRRPVVAFIADDATAAALQTGLEGIEAKLEIKRGNVEAAARYLEKTPRLGAVIVDVSGVEDPFAQLDGLARVCPPDVSVMVVGDSADIGFYRMLVNSLGVTEYLPKPVTRDAVQTLLRPHLAGDEAEAASDAARGGNVIVVCGAQGGAGATSLAVNLTYLLSDSTKATVALLDLHLQDGEAAVMLGARPGPGLRMALEDPLRADGLLLERTAIEVDKRVRLFAADESLEQDLEVTEAGVRHLLALLRRKFNYIVVDLPVPVPVSMRPVIGVAKQVFVLLEAEITGNRNARALRTLMTRMAGANRVFTVLNQADRKGGMAPAIIEKGLGTAPDIVIPDLGSGMVEAINLGVPAIRHVPALRRYLAPIVREVAGLDAEPEPSRFLRLFRK